MLSINKFRFLMLKSAQGGKQGLASNVSANADMRMGFLGTGKIAQAIILGLIKKEKLKPEQIYVSDVNKEYLSYLRDKSPLFQEHKINFVNDNTELVDRTNTVMFCVKPKDMIAMIESISSRVTDGHLLLSIAAGVQLRKIERGLARRARVIRIMTNTAALIQQSCSVFARGTHATREDARSVQSLLEAIGTCEDEIAEDLMDAVTALSGSGPAYMFLILDALADGGVKMGLTRPVALRLAAQTMLGSSMMVMNELGHHQGHGGCAGRHIMQMKEEVCSPAGTTIYGVSELERGRVRSAFIRCIEAATNRAKELNK